MLVLLAFDRWHQGPYLGQEVMYFLYYLIVPDFHSEFQNEFSPFCSQFHSWFFRVLSINNYRFRAYDVVVARYRE